MAEILDDVTGPGVYGRQVNAWKETLPRESMEQMVQQVNDDSAKAAEFADAAAEYYAKMASLTANKVDKAPVDDSLYGLKNDAWVKVPEVLSFPVTEYTGGNFNDLALLKPHDYTMRDLTLANSPVSNSFALTGNYYLTVRQLSPNSVVQQVQNDVGDIAFRHATLNDATLVLTTTPWKVIEYGTGGFGVKTLPNNTTDYTVTIADVATPIIKVGVGCTSSFTVRLRGGDMLSYVGSGFSDVGVSLPVSILDVNHGIDTIPAGAEFLINNSGTTSGIIEVDGVGGSFGGIVGKKLAIKPGDTFSVTRDETGNNWFVLGGAGGGVDEEVLGTLIGNALKTHVDNANAHPDYLKKSPEDEKTYLLKNGGIVEYTPPTVDPNELVKGLARILSFFSINQTGYVSGNLITSFIANEPFILKNNFEGSQADYTLGDLYSILPNNALVAIYLDTGAANTRIGSIQFTPGSHVPAFIQYQATNTVNKGDKLNFVVDSLVGVTSLTINLVHVLA